MGRLVYWILAAILFGILAGGLYTWMSPRKERRLVLALRSMAVYSAIALLAVYIIKVMV